MKTIKEIEKEIERINILLKEKSISVFKNRNLIVNREKLKAKLQTKKEDLEVFLGLIEDTSDPDPMFLKDKLKRKLKRRLEGKQEEKQDD